MANSTPLELIPPVSAPPGSTPPEATHRLRIVILAGVLIVTGVIVGVIAVAMLSSKRPRISPDITAAVTFPIYVPKHLPPGYKIVTGSFKFTSQESSPVLAFEAADSAGDRLVFTEQARPGSFDSAKFTNANFVGPITLKGVPYPTVTGKTNDKQTTLLSIDTGKTWILVSTQAPLSNQDLQRLAQGTYKY